MSFWAAAQLQPTRERLACHFLETVAGFDIYDPQVREYRANHGRRVEVLSCLFPGYTFVRIELQWHEARWCPGVIRLVMDGVVPARVPDKVITDIQSRERNGVVVLPGQLKPGDKVQITDGLFVGQFGLFAGMSAHERVIVLLTVLGGSRVTMPRGGIAPA